MGLVVLLPSFHQEFSFNSSLVPSENQKRRFKFSFRLNFENFNQAVFLFSLVVQMSLSASSLTYFSALHRKLLRLAMLSILFWWKIKEKTSIFSVRGTKLKRPSFFQRRNQMSGMVLGFASQRVASRMVASARCFSGSSRPQKHDEFVSVISAELEKIRAAGTFKTERVITSPQRSHISVAGYSSMILENRNDFIFLIPKNFLLLTFF